MTAMATEFMAAMRAAEENFARNLESLRNRQPALAQEVAELSPEVEWVSGRDGSLTARLLGGGWWSGCSLPQRAANALLEKMDLRAPVTCFLSPTHAAQVRVTLDRLGDGRALIAVVPEMIDLRLMLSCDGFDEAIASGRLWFAAGEGWDQALEQILSDHDGLPTPGQFVRTPLVEAARMDAMIAAAQGVFSREIARRARAVQSLFAEATPLAGKVCVVAHGTFRLWEDAGHALAGIAAQEEWTVMNPDDPSRASPVAFARAAAGCGAVVTINTGRADLPSDLPTTTRVVSWITGPRIPRFVETGTEDRLLVADQRWKGLAISSGWRADRIEVAGWPAQRLSCAGSGLGVIADTLPLVTPEFELSSHRVLWDSIALELSRDPFAAGLDAQAYLSRWLRGTKIAAESLDQTKFVDRLIVPAHQQGLVRWLIEAGIEIRLFGGGWDQIDEFARRHRGAVRTLEGLYAAVQSCAGLAHVWPANWAHPIESAGRPVLRRGSKEREMWLAEARRLARGESRALVPAVQEISRELLWRAIGLT
jgi:hypothetical protein